MTLSDDPHALRITAVLVFAGVLLFASSFNDPFHFDDVLITNDTNVTNPALWFHFFNPLHLRQLTFFTFYLNHLAGGTDPSGYHIVNVLLQVANAVLLFLLLERFVERWIAIAAAFIFLVHPIQTSAVLYVYERSTLLACFFSLLGLIAIAERRVGWAVVSFALAFEGKESAIAVPLALAVLPSPFGRGRRVEDAPGEGLRSGQILQPTPGAPARWLSRRPLPQGEGFRTLFVVGAALLSAFALGILVRFNEQTVGIGAAAQTSPFRYLLIETRVVYTYLRLLVFPYPQSLEYDFHESGGILAAGGIVLMIAAGYWLYRNGNERLRVAGLCILAFFILLAPTSSVVPSADAAFEHRLYLPMLAFSLFAASLLASVPQRNLVAAAALIVLAALTIGRERIWSSDIALWEDTVQKAPGKARVWFNLGGAYLNTDPDKAHAAFLRALELQPHFTEALYDLGLIEQTKQNWNMALAY
ncbi:MAG: hypothetical protein DME75_13795, partial [Verrucomicrobia bacterium]